MTKEQERERLNRDIWAVAETLRGVLDGWDFKSYLLGAMFYRYLSEHLTACMNKGGFKNYAHLSDAEAEKACCCDMQRNRGCRRRNAFIMRCASCTISQMGN